MTVSVQVHHTKVYDSSWHTDTGIIIRSWVVSCSQDTTGRRYLRTEAKTLLTCRDDFTGGMERVLREYGIWNMGSGITPTQSAKEIRKLHV